MKRKKIIKRLFLTEEYKALTCIWQAWQYSIPITTGGPQVLSGIIKSTEIRVVPKQIQKWLKLQPMKKKRLRVFVLFFNIIIISIDIRSIQEHYSQWKKQYFLHKHTKRVPGTRQGQHNVLTQPCAAAEDKYILTAHLELAGPDIVVTLSCLGETRGRHIQLPTQDQVRLEQCGDQAMPKEKLQASTP